MRIPPAQAYSSCPIHNSLYIPHTALLRQLPPFEGSPRAGAAEYVLRGDVNNLLWRELVARVQFKILFTSPTQHYCANSPLLKGGRGDVNNLLWRKLAACAQFKIHNSKFIIPFSAAAKIIFFVILSRYCTFAFRSY